MHIIGSLERRCFKSRRNRQMLKMHQKKMQIRMNSTLRQKQFGVRRIVSVDCSISSLFKVLNTNHVKIKFDTMPDTISNTMKTAVIALVWYTYRAVRTFDPPSAIFLIRMVTTKYQKIKSTSPLYLHRVLIISNPDVRQIYRVSEPYRPVPC